MITKLLTTIVLLSILILWQKRKPRWYVTPVNYRIDTLWEVLRLCEYVIKGVDLEAILLRTENEYEEEV